MENNMMKVWKVDISFEPYSMHEVLIGANNEEEIIENLGKICQKKFKKYQIKDIRDSLGTFWSRIREIPNLYTDVPLKILDGSSYYE